MKLSAENVKTFLRLQRKHNVSTKFILGNMAAILKFVKYAVTPHIVLKQKLFRRRNRIFLRYNYPRKLIFDPSQLKRRRRAKRIHSQWSKRMVMHLRNYKTVQFIEDEVTKVPEELVSQQMKEQLELLKTGKRSVPLLEDADHVDSVKMISADDENSEAESDSEELSNRSATPLSVNEDEPEMSATQDEPKSITTATTTTLPNENGRSNGNFLDMLISKSKNTADEVCEMEPPKQCVKLRVCSEVIENDERENSNSSSDFFGFDDNERILGTSPGMLSTPVVRRSNSNAPFESETLNAFMRDNSLESSDTIKVPHRWPECGLVFTHSIPPNLDRPALPEGLQCHRTVAEKRAFLQRTRNTKYFLINNVNTLCGELQNRSKGRRINKQSIESMQWSSSIPLTRQAWKVAAFLLTDVGNYYFQTINVDGENFRLFGCRGNSPRKFIRSHSNKCGKIVRVCPEECIDRITFRAFRPIRTLERRSKLSDVGVKTNCKACPLSQKIVTLPQDDEPVFASLDIVRMPQVELDVYPQLQKPLNEIAKRYLQLILPYNEISREWAEFSVSTLVKRDELKQATAVKPERPFTFKLPYRNDRSHVLVHRVYTRSEALEGISDKNQLSFRKEIDQKKANGEPPDLVANECADILTDMLNSVAISCSEDSFLKDDPDNIYQLKSTEEDLMMEKSVKKVPELHHQHAAPNNRKQSRLLMELRRLNATIIDAATSKTDEDGVTCDKESCRLGCVCASLNEGTTIRQHCGKQRCVLDCKCKCTTVMRLETDGRTITTEDAYMLRRQATAKLARMEKEFTSTIVLTGSETLLINESQYDKKRRCTKIPKRYGDFVDPDEPEFSENKPLKRVQPSTAQNFPLEPILIQDKIYQHLKHCSVNIKRMRDVKDLVPWCMIHMVYKCNCKGQAIVGNPIVVEKREELTGGTTIEETPSNNSRTAYSFDKEESKASGQVSSSYDSETSESNDSDSESMFTTTKSNSRNSNLSLKLETRGRKADVDCIGVYMNTKANHCRRVVPIPRNTYQRRNKKRFVHVQLYIAENETDQTRLSLNEHVLRSVYYHKNKPNAEKQSNSPTLKEEHQSKVEETHSEISAESSNQSSSRPPSKAKKRKICEDDEREQSKLDKGVEKRFREASVSSIEEGASLLRVNRYKDPKPDEISKFSATNSSSPSDGSQPFPPEKITIPKISQIFSLNAQARTTDICTNTATTVGSDISQQSNETAADSTDVDGKCQTVFQIVIKNMNNLVSKKMQDIDMALRRESKAIPAPNDEILCIIRWNNFLEAFIEGFVYLWEVRTENTKFIAGTIRSTMPLVENALSVINIRALQRDSLPLLGRMLIDRIKKPATDGLAVVMQGQKMYWFVKGFLRPDKTRICQKPTPDTHPLLTKKINILCRLLINQQANDHKKRQESLNPSQLSPVESLNSPVSITNVHEETVMRTLTPVPPLHSIPPKATSLQNNHRTYGTVPVKVKVLPMQRNISDQACEILEQMVCQAYGAVRSNISFRKLRQAEGKEIFLPLALPGDHQWLVLDLCNDFSHIFVPELKDLLTLDRIQKVISYAIAKGRIVKMQFSQQSLFNAYVTSSSRTKLYFGPFRNEFQTPNLVLLQSVDGQMMLREVYEARHMVTLKTERTCSFWLTQRSGQLFLDIETEPPQDVHEIIDDEEISSAAPSKTTAIEPVANILVKVDAKNVQNVATPSEVVPLEQVIQRSVEEHDDDDCVIINDDEGPKCPVTSTTAERINFTISYGGENSSLVVTQNQGDMVSNVTQQNSFTILAPDVVLPLINNGEPTPEPQGSVSLPVNVESKANAVSIQETVINTQTSSLVQPTLETLPNAPATVSKDEAAPKTYPCGKGPPSSYPTRPPAPIQTITIQPLPPLVTAPINSQQNPQPSIVSGTPEPETNVSKPNTVSVNWSKNITITKLQMDSDSTPCSTPSCVPNSQAMSSTALGRKSMTLMGSENAKVMGQNRLSLPGILQTQTKTAIGKTPAPPKKTRLVTAQDYRRHLANNPALTTSQKTTRIMATPNQTQPIRQNQVQRQITSNVIPSIVNQRPTTVTSQRPVTFTNPRPAYTPQSGLTIRTPTAINTFAKSQQFIRQSSPATATATATMSGGSVIRTINTSLTRMPASTSPSSPARASLNGSTVFKHPTHAVFLKNSPNTPVRPTIVKPRATLQPGPIKRVLPKQGVLSGVPPKKIQLISSAEKATLPSSSSEGDPLHIPKDPTDTSVNKLLKPKLPSDVKTLVRNIPNVKTISPATIPSDSGGVKRNSTGMIVNRTPAQFLQVKQGSQSTNAVTSTAGNQPATQSATQVKGIPIDLPRLKKFAIIGSPNTTVITPITASHPQSVGMKGRNDPSTSTLDTNSSPPKKRLLASAFGLMKSNPSTCTKPLPSPEKTAGASSSSASSSSPSNSSSIISNPNRQANKPVTQYGYFHANMEGLPKFVVKRVNDDFLIKVPNFNGILRLTSLTTVRNYLNQYTTHKCGKTPEEIVNLQWTFKEQDRSQLSGIHKSNSPTSVRPGIANQGMQRPLNIQRNSSTTTSSPKTANKNTKPVVTPNASGSNNDAIVLLDD